MNNILTPSLAVVSVTITLAAMSSSVAFWDQDSEEECEERITAYSEDVAACLDKAADLEEARLCYEP